MAVHLLMSAAYSEELNKRPNAALRLLNVVAAWTLGRAMPDLACLSVSLYDEQPVTLPHDYSADPIPTPEPSVASASRGEVDLGDTLNAEVAVAAEPSKPAQPKRERNRERYLRRGKSGEKIPAYQHRKHNVRVFGGLKPSAPEPWGGLPLVRHLVR